MFNYAYAYNNSKQFHKKLNNDKQAKDVAWKEKTNKKLSYHWQTRATRLEVSQCH